jgi:hypothetical protein
MVSSDWLELLPPSERAKPPVKMVASITCIEGRVRRSEELPKMADDTFHGTVTIDPAEFVGEVDIQLMLIRTAVAAKVSDGLAADRGVRLTWSEEQKILLSPPKLPHGSFIQVEWEDFSNSGGDLANFSNSFFHLDQTGTNPKLLLNQAVSNELYKIMEFGGHGHEKALVRDTIFSFIAMSVMQTMLQDIARQLNGDADGAPPADIENLREWQRRLIEDLAADLYPEYPEDDALQHLLHTVCSEDGLSELIRLRIPLANQANRSVKRACEKLAEQVYAYG